MTPVSTINVRSRPSRSLFAALLRDLIEHTDIFPRSEWATTLGVTPAAISQWLNDKTVPRPRTLRSLLDVVRRYRGNDNKYLQSFLAIVDKPAHTVSPLGGRLGSSVGGYLASPVLEGFLRQLGTLSYSIQEAVLLNAVAECERLIETSEGVEQRTELSDVRVAATAASTSIAPAGSEPFIGRDAELMQVRHSLSEGRPVALLGAPGAGKTALAGEIVRRLFGSSPCQAIRRFEFKKFHDLPWDDLRRYFVAAHHGRRTEQQKDGHDSARLDEHQSVFFVFDDVHMAHSQQREALVGFLRECADAGPRFKVIVTYVADRSTDVHSLVTAVRRARPLSAVYLSRLREGDIAQLWSALLANVAKTCSADSLRYATWLAAGSPGYCRQLADRARACTGTEVPITEYDVVEASQLLLNDTDGGLTAVEALNTVSPKAQSVALWSAIQDVTVEAEEAGLPQFYRAVNEVRANEHQDLSDAIDEACSHGLTESVSIGDRPAITLRNESHRSYFRSVALTRFKHVPAALLTKGQVVITT